MEKRKLILQIKREMTFHVDYMSCLHCACNYSCQDAIGGRVNPVFCQTFSRHIDPASIEENEETARTCANWVPRGIDRSKTVVPDVERWYEKDSMG